MAQNREIKEETTELKSHETQLSASRCTPPQQTIPSLTSRATASSDPNDKPDGACPPRAEEEAQPADLAATQRPLKRPRVENPSRCSGSGCRRRVGLMGFRCRCGDVFCSEHRYSDRHECSFDYKAAGREAIRRENPVVRAAKLVKV